MTADQRDDDVVVVSRLEGVAQTAPTVDAALVAAWTAATAALDPAVFDAIHRRVEDILVEREGSASGVGDTEHDGVLAVVDRFVDYVPDVSEEQLSPLRDRLGKQGLRDVVEVLYLVDQATRLRITHEKLFGPGTFAPLGPAPAPPEKTARPARANFVLHDAILAREEGRERHALDTVTRELVRLRAGWYHQCGLCSSLRWVDPGNVPFVGENRVEQLPEYERGDFDEGQKAALAYADAHMTNPMSLDDSVRERLRASFRPEQIVQLTLEVTSWNYQKVLVALGIDHPVSDEGLTAMTVDDHGSTQVGDLVVS